MNKVFDEREANRYRFILIRSAESFGSLDRKNLEEFDNLDEAMQALHQCNDTCDKYYTVEVEELEQ